MGEGGRRAAYEGERGRRAPYVGERGRRATAGGVEGAGDGGRRRGRGRRRAASRARQRTSGEMEATGRAVVFIAPPFSRGWGGDPRLKDFFGGFFVPARNHL